MKDIPECGIFGIIAKTSIALKMAAKKEKKILFPASVHEIQTALTGCYNRDLAINAALKFIEKYGD